MRFREILTEAAYDAKINKLLAKYPDYQEDIRWARPNLRRQDRIIWYLNVIEQELGKSRQVDFSNLRQTLEHYMSLPVPAIQNFIWPPRAGVRDILNPLENFELEWQRTEGAKQPPRVEPGDQVLMRFPNGNYWIRLDRAYCAEEGRSGRHCGNVVGRQRPDQRILSLRNARGHVILTFILEPDGTLGEMKAVANQKPDEKYHPEIMALLMSPTVRGITGQGFLPDQNFSVFDLSEQQLKQIYQEKPRLISDQASVTPAEILKAPDWIKNDRTIYTTVISRMPGLAEVYRDPSIENWQQLVNQQAGMILYAPENLPDYAQRLMTYLQKNSSVASDLLRAPRSYRKNFKFLSELLRVRPIYLSAVPATTPRYQELAYIATEADGAIERVDPAYRDLKIYQLGVERQPRQINRVPNKILDAHPELLELAVRSNPYIFASMPRGYWTYELAQLAVSLNGDNIQHLPSDWRDEDMWMRAVKQDGETLRFKSETSLSDTPPEIFKAAVDSNGMALRFVPENMIDRQMALTAVRQYNFALKFVPLRLLDDEICLTAFNAIPREKQRVDPETGAVGAEQHNQDGLSVNLEWVPEDIRGRHIEISRQAVKNNSWNIEFVPVEHLLRDKNISLGAISDNANTIQDIPRQVLERYPEIARAAVNDDVMTLHRINEAFLMNHPEIIELALELDADRAIMCMSDELIRHHDRLIIPVAQENPQLLNKIPEEYITDNIKHAVIDAGHSILDIPRGLRTVELWVYYLNNHYKNAVADLYLLNNQEKAEVMAAYRAQYKD